MMPSFVFSIEAGNKNSGIDDKSKNVDQNPGNILPGMFSVFVQLNVCLVRNQIVIFAV